MLFADISVESKYSKPMAMDYILWCENKLKLIKNFECHGFRMVAHLRTVPWGTHLYETTLQTPLQHLRIHRIFFPLSLSLLRDPLSRDHPSYLLRFPVLPHELDARVSDDGSPSALTETMISTCLTRNILFHFCSCGSAHILAGRTLISYMSKCRISHIVKCPYEFTSVVIHVGLFLIFYELVRN